MKLNINKKIIFFFSITALLLVFSSNKTQAAFSCDTGSLADGDTCTVTSNKTLDGGENITGANANLVLSNNAQIIGYLGSAATITIQNLTINSGSYINFNGKGQAGGAGGTSGHTSGYNGNISGSGGGNAGTVDNGGGGGGGYGGVGGNAYTVTGGIENGQATLHQPTTLGSGGGGGGYWSFGQNGGVGGNGGGAIKLVISGTLNNGGYISANGDVGAVSGGYGGGGGSGGSIWISAGTIAGSGTIRANGGTGGTGYLGIIYAGGGSGGRITLTYATDNSSSFTKQSFGGLGFNSVYAPSGSIYVKQDSAAYGDLSYDNGGNTSYFTRTISSSYGIQNFNNFTFKEGSATGLTINSGAVLNVYGRIITTSNDTFVSAFINNGTFTQNSAIYTSLTFSSTFSNSNVFTANNLTVLTFLSTNANTGTITADALQALNINGTSTNSGIFSAIDGAEIATLSNLNIGGLMTLDPGTYALPDTLNVTINNGGTLTHSANTTAKTYYLDLTIANLTINSGGYVNIDGKGYAGGAANGGTGIGSGGGGGGGNCGVSWCGGGSGGGAGYGGVGGIGAAWTMAGGSGGVEYDQSLVNASVSLGSGGGGGGRGYYSAYENGGAGGAGGGAVKLNISGTFTLNSGGYITANGSVGANDPGTYGGAGGGGSGGSIWIQAGTIVGSGTIRANGGNGGNGYAGGYLGGGGSGGRVVITYATDSSSNYAKTTYGGSGNQYGSSGSIYIK
ncbi:MAG: hypothetical protein WA019_05540, partial [Candidatus Moraniibacteriota bacterium]